jgi:hypothetical protein
VEIRYLLKVGAKEIPNFHKGFPPMVFLKNKKFPMLPGEYDEAKKASFGHYYTLQGIL